MAKDPRMVTIAFAGDTKDIDEKFKQTLKEVRDFGLEVEVVSKKLGKAFDQIGSDGKVIGKLVPVEMQIKAIAKSFDLAQEAQKRFQEGALKFRSGFPKLTVKGNIEDTEENAARKKAEKLQAQLLSYDEKTSEARRVARHDALVTEAEEEKNFLKAAQLRRQEEELAAERRFIDKLNTIRARIADPNDKFNVSNAAMSRSAAIRQYEQERLQIRQLAQETRAFAEESKLLAQQAKTEALSTGSNPLVKMRAQVAQQELDIEQRKNQKLLSLAVSYQAAKTAEVRQGLAQDRLVTLQAYQEELRQLQVQKNKLREMEVKATKSAGGYGVNFGDLAARIIEVNVLWNAVNKLNSAISNAVTSIIPLGIQLDAVKASLQSTIGGTSATTDVLAALSEEAQRTGLEIGNLRNNFKLFQASTSLAGASLQKTWKMFTDLNTVSAALHLTNEQTNSVFLAMAQIFNKGKVQAEELVRQLGNLLPGAFASFAAATGRTTQKLMEDMEAGRVMAQDTMDKFTSYMAGRFSGAFATASQGLNADINRMNTEFTKLGETIYSLVRGPVQSFIQSITEVTRDIGNATKGTTDLTVVLRVAGAVIETVAVAGLVRLTQKLLTATQTTKSFETAFAFLKSPVGIVTGIYAIVTAIDVLGQHLNSARDSTASFLEEQLRLKKIAEGQNAPLGVKIENAIENDDTVKKILQQIEQDTAELNKLKSGEFLSTTFSTSSIEALNKGIEKLRQLTSLGPKELPTLLPTDLDEKKVAKAITYYETVIRYHKKQLELSKQNVEQEIKLRQQQEDQANTTSKYGNENKIKEEELVKAKLAMAERDKAQAEANKDFKEVERINQRILELQKEQLEVNKKGSAVAQDLLRVQTALEELGKKENLTAAEQKRKMELAKELGQLMILKRGADAQAETDYIRNSERLKQKERSETKKEFPLLDAETKTKLEELKTAAKEEETRYKNLEQTAYQYYANTAQLKKTALDEEINAHQKRMDLLSDEREKQTEAEKIEQLQQEKKTVLEDINQKYQKDYEDIVTMLARINTKYLESVGRYAESGLSKVQEETKNQVKVLEGIIVSAENGIEGNSFFDAQGEKAKQFAELVDKAKTGIEQLKAATFDSQAEGFFKQYNEKAQFIDKELAIKEIMIRTRQKSGAITEFGALMERQTAIQEYIKNKQSEITILEESLNTIKGKEDAASRESVARKQQELNEKKALLAEFVANSNLLADRFETIFSDAFSNSFAAFVSGTQTAAEAFQSFAQSVIQSLARMAAQEMASQIFGYIKTAIGVAGGLTGGVGTVPGTTVSKSSLAGLVDSAGGYPFLGNYAHGGIPPVGSVKQSFLMANGAVGTLRERGPEAILPLQRDSKGNLGVSTITDKSEKTGLNIENIQINVENKKEESGPDLANTIAETLVRRLADEQIQKASRPGNLLNKTTRFG